MDPQLYLPECDRNYIKKQIERYFSFLLDGIKFFYNKLEEGDVNIDELQNKPGGDSIGDRGIEEQYDYFIEYSEYCYDFYENFLGFCFVQFYHFWEKQVRGFLYKEFSKDIKSVEYKKDRNVKKKNTKEFFVEEITNLKDIKEMFMKYDIDIESFHDWKKISEFNKICNTYKHGVGKSADSISNLIKDEDNLDIKLEVDKDLLIKYKKAILEFRDFIPEKSYRKQSNPSLTTDIF